VPGQLHLVGSIPLDTPQEVFETFGAPLGRYLHAMPDGEVGPRRHWISRVHYQVLAAHPELEIVQRPAPDENGVERQFPRNAGDAWHFRVKAGVDQVRFGDPGWRLGYARDALNSYFVFRVMKERGVLPKHLRFQVSIPMVNSVLPPRIFPDPADIAKIRPGYAAATRAEIATIIAQIPNDELALQWDCSTELQDAYGGIPGHPREGAIERNLDEVRALSPAIPGEVELGYHFCFGTLGGWPRFVPDDLGRAVELANAFVAASGRRVDWIHLPVLDRSDDAFFAPLARLEPQGARVYLGAIHNMGTFVARLAVARKYLPAFGLGAYCGFGRLPPAELAGVLADHLKAVELAAA
jgi:catechol 2,3-dioxygenase-like lactoylglutathione lyase family enzyme